MTYTHGIASGSRTKEAWLRGKYSDHTGRAEETWVMNVGVAVVIDNEGGALIKVEVCDRKRRVKTSNRQRMTQTMVWRIRCVTHQLMREFERWTLWNPREFSLYLLLFPVLTSFESAFPCAFNLDVRMAAMRNTEL